MAPSGQVQRKCCGYFTQVVYADRTEAPERGSYETGLLVPPLLPRLSSFSLSLSLSQGVGYMSLAVSGSSCTIFSGKWPYLALLRCLRPRGGGWCGCGGGVGGGTTTKILKIFHSESTRRLTSPPQSWETGKQYWYINHAAAVICWLHSRECDKVSFAGCCLLNSMVVFVVVISKQFFWRKTTELSLGLTREKQVVQLGALPPSCSSQACKRSSVGKGQCACVYACVVMYAFHIGPCAS